MLHIDSRSFAEVAQRPFGDVAWNLELNYMHDNPCSGKWNLCNSPIDYLHSSAKYYLTGEDGFYVVTDVEDD